MQCLQLSAAEAIWMQQVMLHALLALAIASVETWHGASPLHFYVAAEAALPPEVEDAQHETNHRKLLLVCVQISRSVEIGKNLWCVERAAHVEIDKKVIALAYP